MVFLLLLLHHYLLLLLIVARTHTYLPTHTDEGANPAHVAADLLSQAEHGPDSQVVLLALPGVDLDAVQLQVQKQCDELPRSETARKALSHSCIVQVG